MKIFEIIATTEFLVQMHLKIFYNVNATGREKDVISSFSFANTYA